MNFIYIHTHDSGREIEPYGIQAHNPALMRLAAESCLFRNAHCVAPTCSPSRAGMLTGMTAHNSGMLGLAHRGFCLNDNSQHLAPYLKKHGYYTALFGVQHEARRAEMIGYDEFHEDHIKKSKPPRFSDIKTLELAIDFLHQKPNGDKPFFMSFGMRSTHRPFMESDGSHDAFLRPPFPISDTPETRHDWGQYLQTLEVADHCIGELMRELAAQELLDKTIVMFTTDHGVAFPQMKCNLYDTGTGVALMLRVPGMAPKCTDALVSHVDIFPTVCDLLRVSHPSWLQGKSLLPILRGEREQVNDYIFSEVSFHATYEPARAIRSRNMKLIRLFEQDTVSRLPNIDDSPSKERYLSGRLSRLPRQREMLFDLIADPAERVNVIDVPEYAKAYAELSAALNAHMEQTDDPLLKGHIPLADGWVMNTPYAYSPESTTYNNQGIPAKAGSIPGTTIEIEPKNIS